jgi:hypothetical protein
VKRIVQPELLDSLPAEDPHAIRSRRDLQRVNAWMGNHAILAGALNNACNGLAVRKITELGAGDGNFLLSVAKKIAPRWPGLNVTLLDLQNNISAETLAAFGEIGWHAESVVADVFNWSQTDAGLVIANLFLHHFEEIRLSELLRLISRRAKIFIAIEPRRAGWPLFCSRFLWAIGCGEVTLHDATISVRAGFSGDELSKLWPDENGWELKEQKAGAFSHLFIARKIS